MLTLGGGKAPALMKLLSLPINAIPPEPKPQKYARVLSFHCTGPLYCPPYGQPIFKACVVSSLDNLIKMCRESRTRKRSLLLVGSHKILLELA